MTHWRLLADDLTGALDTAAAWCTAQLAVPVFLDRPAPSTAPVQAVSTGSRDLPTAASTALLAASLDWLCQGERAYKKVDSLLRGNSLAEVAWLLRQGRFQGAVFAPAFPAQGRFTARGRHWVGPPCQPAAGTLECVVDDLVAAFAAHGVQVETGPERPDTRSSTGQPVLWLPDALHAQDLQGLAALAHSPAGAGWLWCGSAGLAQAIANPDPSPTVSLATTPAALVTASQHPVLRQQLHTLRAAWPDAPLADFMAAQPLAPVAAAQALHAALQRWVDTRPAPPVLAVVGGDTLLALCRCTGATALQAGPTPRPGWGQAALLDGRWRGTLCLTRSGAFGAADDLLALWPHLDLETHE